MSLNRKVVLYTLFSLFTFLACNQSNSESTPLLPDYVNDDWVRYETNSYILFFPDSLDLDTNFLNLEFIIRSNQIGETDFMENLNIERTEIDRNELSNLDKTITETIATYLNGQITESNYKNINNVKYKFDKCQSHINGRDYTFLVYNHLIDTTKYQVTVTMEKKSSNDYALVFEQVIGTLSFK